MKLPRIQITGEQEYDYAASIETMNSLRKLIALVCLLAVLVAALCPGTSGVFNACLALVVFVFGLAPLVVVPGTEEACLLPQSGWISIRDSRAPPLL